MTNTLKVEQKDKIMAQKSDFKTVETDLDELEEKIRKHRRKIAKRIIIVVAAVVALFLIVWVVDGTAHLQVI